jgi:hypothetical protein
MSFAYDHERFVAKNKSLASAEDIKRRDDLLEKKGFDYLKRQEKTSCFNCKMKTGCSEFKARRSGGAKGVVSFGGDESFLCDKYVPAPTREKSLSDKQIKSLLKNAKKGF